MLSTKGGIKAEHAPQLPGFRASGLPGFRASGHIIHIIGFSVY
jgi:hypothetical protein